MSFRQSWETMCQRTYAFNKGAGDKRDADNILLAIDRWMSEAHDCIGADGVVDVPGLQFALASIVSEVMHLERMLGLDVADALIEKNTKIRAKWREDHG